MTDKLTPGQLRDLAELLKQHREARDGWPSSPQSLVGFLREEAARREAEGNRTSPETYDKALDWMAERDGILGREGPGSAAVRLRVERDDKAGEYRVENLDKPAPAADDLVAFLRGRYQLHCTQAADRIEAQAREIAERDARLAMVTRERDRLHVECSGHMAENARLREALTEAVDVFGGMADDEIDSELLPRLRAALARGGEHG